MFLDTLSSPQEVQFLTNRFAQHKTPPVVLEVGVGSGVVLAFITSNSYNIVGRPDVLALGTDLNSIACQAASKTVEKACKAKNSPCDYFLGSMQTDLCSSLRPGTVDILLFNPPYVPSEEIPHALQSTLINSNFKSSFELSSNLLALSYAGGVDGMETTNRLLEDLPRVLNSDRGVAYILLCAQNKPDKVMDRVRSWGSTWNVIVSGHSGRKAGWESLKILRIWRSP
jgi:release factor glutamine methyltransferase